MSSPLDTPALLELMLDDAANIPAVYRPTNYWAVYHEKIVPELREQGLHNFRRRKVSMFSKFNGRDKPFQTSIELQQLLEQTESRARLAGAKPLDCLEISLVGSPKALFEWKGKKYTANMLNYYLDYAYCSQFVNWEAIRFVVELGSGAGKQVEVLKKLYPHLTFLLFDMAPELYVCQQYLSAVFPNSTISYEETRQWSSLPSGLEGKIAFFGNWKFPILETITADLFWSCATFQEMEPDVVAHYLSFVNRVCRVVFLSQELEGKSRAPQLGESGVITPTTYQNYHQGLPDFELIDLSQKWSFEPSTLHSSFWQSKLNNCSTLLLK